MFVVDASFLSKTLGGEPGSEKALNWLETTRRAGTMLRGPSLLAYEVAHVLHRRFRGMPAAEKAEVLTALLLGIRLEEAMPEPTFAIDGLTYYDASYLEIARRRGATLVTADKPMAAAAKRLGVAVKLL